MKENKFDYFNDLEEGLRLQIMSFSSPPALAEIAAVSKETNNLSKEDYLWNPLLKDKTSSAKNAFRDHPEKHLVDYLEVPGRMGARLCRQVLRNDPENINALSRLAFLLEMGETEKQPGDTPIFTAPPRELLRRTWEQKRHYESLYYLGKIATEKTPHPPTALRHLTSVLEHNPNHVGAICCLARLSNERKITASDTDFLFPPEAPRSPPPDTKDYPSLLKNRALFLYQKAIQINPKKTPDILCSLADSERKNSLPISPTELPIYAELMGTPNLTIEDPGQNLNLTVAAMLYRKILAQNPQHLGAVLGLAELISRGDVLAQPNDFLPSEKTNQRMLLDFWDQEHALYGRIHKRHAKANTEFKHRELQQLVCKQLQAIPADFWPEFIREDIAHFKNLTANQRAKIVLAARNTENLDDQGVKATLPYVTLIASTALPMLILCFNTDKLGLSWASWELETVTAFYATFVLSCFYFLAKDIRTSQQKASVHAITTDNGVLQALYPTLNGAEQIALLRLYHIPQAKWADKTNFITNFLTHKTADEKKQISDHIQEIETQDISHHPQVRKARAAEIGIKASIGLPLLAIGGYAMYQTYDWFEGIDARKFYLFLGVVTMAFFVGSVLECWIDPHWADDTQKSLQDDSIINSITALPPDSLP